LILAKRIAVSISMTNGRQPPNWT